MKKQDMNITPGQDKFLPVNLDEQMAYKPDPLLRFQIDELSKPIRRSIRPPAPDSSARITASLVTALLILGATIAIVHCNG